MMKTKLRCLNCILAMTLICATAHGDIMLSEPPDFGFSFGGPSLDTLDLGINTISGNVFYETDEFSDISDVVALTLPEGLEIIAMEMTVSNYEGFPGGSFMQSNIWLQLPGGGFFFIDGMSIAENGTVQFPAGSLPISTPGVYDFDQHLLGVLLNNNADWQLTVTTASSVPEPTSLALLSLCGLLVIGRRRR